jgi:hypothetical protein
MDRAGQRGPGWRAISGFTIRRGCLSYAAVGILLFANVINLAADIAAMDDALGLSPGR